MKRFVLVQPLCWMLILVCGSIATAPTAYAANGAALYIDFNGTTAGFGTPGGTIDQATAIWTTNNAGTAATTAYVSGDQLTVGAVLGDSTFNGQTFSIALNQASGQSLNGVLINSTGANITLTGSANVHPTSSSTWTVAAGSTLTVNDTRQSFDTTSGTVKGLNWNNQATTFAGGGTINFPTPFGANSSSALFTENMPGGVINIQIGAITAGDTISYGGNFTLTAGTLNFASAGSAFQFGSAATHTVTIGGGSIDNTSTTPTLNLALGGGSFAITGDFTYTGTTNSLDFGTANVALSGANRQITITSNTLTIDGAISGASSGLIKAGSGTLALTGSNSYTGATSVSAGTLILSGNNSYAGATTIGGTLKLQTAGTNNISSSSAITVNSGGTLDVTGVAGSGGFALGGTQTLANNGGFVTGNVMASVGQSITGSGGTFNGGSTVTVAGGTLVPGVANVSTGTMTMNNLTMSSSALWKIKVGGATSDLIAVSGTADFTGGGNSLLSVQQLSTPTAGSYTVLTAGTLSGLTAGTIGNIGRSTYSIDGPQLASNILQIDITGTPATLAWTGSDTGTNPLQWDNLQSNANWFATANGGLDSTHFYDGDNVVFDDSHNTQSFPTTINIATNVAPTSITLTQGSNHGYVFSTTTSGSITGGSLLMNSSDGTGSLTINTTNSYNGGTTVQSGTVNANATGALGTGAVVVNGGTLNLGAAGAMGNGPLSITSGKLNFAANGSIGSGMVTFGGGIIDNTSGVPITFANNNAQSWSGSFTYAGSNADATHDINLGTGTVSLDGSNITLTMGGSASTLTVGGAIQNGISGTGFTVAGVGKLALNGVSTYTGVTTINGGTVVVGNSAALGSVASAADVFVSGTGAAIDLNGGTAANALNFGDKVFKIAGTGVGGTGALTNSSSGANAASQNNAFNFITLTDNATIGGYRIDIGRTPAPAANGVLNLASHTLTVAMTPNGATTPNPMFDILDKVTVIGNGSIDVTSGTLGFENTATALAANVTNITFEVGENLQMFRNTAGDITVPMTFKGSNTIGGGSTSGTTPTLNSPMTLQGNITFEPMAGGNPTPANNCLLIVAGNITDNSGGFSVTQFGDNTTTISGNNSWTGGTNVTRGTLKLGSNTALPTGTAVTFGSATPTTGILDLAGFNASVGGLTVVAGGTGTITNSSTTTNSTLTYSAGTTSFSGTIQDLTGLTTGTTTVALNVSGGTLTLTGSNNYKGGTTVSGGTLQIGAGNSNAIGTNPNVTVNSGTLDLNGNSITVANLTGSGGVITNTAAASSSTLTVGTATNTTYGGAIQDTGTGQMALTKQGTGTLTLSGSGHTFSGATNINLGTLNVTGSLAGAGGVVNVNTGGTLSGDGDGTSSGLLGNVVLQGGTVNPGTTPATTGKLTMANLTTASSGGNLLFEIGTSGNNDRIVVNQIADFQNASNLTVASTTGSLYLTAGTYTLLSAATLNAGQGGGPGTAPTFMSPMARQTVNLDYSTANTIKLVVADSGQQANLIWNNSVGGGDGQSWDIANNKNWTSSATILDPNKFYNGDNVTFNDSNNFPTNSNAYSVMIPANVNPASLAVNTANTYTFNGSGSIVGSTSLVKTGSGTLVLSNSSNSYSGGTLVQNGTLQVGSSGSLSPNSAITLGDVSNHSGVLDLNGNFATVGGLTTAGAGTGNIVGNSSTTSSATLVFTGGASVFSGTIQDQVNGGTQTTALNVSTGALTLTANNTYTGGTTIANGATLQLGNNTGAGSVVGSIDNEGTLNFARSDNYSATNSISGAGKLIQSGAGTTTLAGSNGYSGGTAINAGTLAIPSDAAINNGSGGITFGGGVLQFINYASTALPAASFNNATNLKLGAATGAQSSLSTVIAGTSALTFVGPGTLVLTGTNTYTGATTITDGTLIATSNASLGSLTSGAVNINGGTLDLGGNATGNNANFGAKQFNIAGNGPAGGFGAAIYNNGLTQQNAFGKVALTADAAIGGSSAGGSAGRIDLRSSTPVLDLAGHKLTKIGGSQFTLVATTVNSTGGTPGTIEVAAGELGLETTTTIGPTAVSLITMDNNTRLEFFQTTSAVTSPVTVAGTGVVIGSGQPSGGAGSTVGSPITLQNDVTFEPINTNAVNPGGTAPVALTGNITESGSHGIAKLGAFSLTLSGNNNYSGGTTIGAGTLVMGSTTALGAATGTLSMSGGTLDMNSHSLTVGNLTGTGGTILSNTSGALTLTVGASTSPAPFAGNIQNGSATVSLIKNGTGAITLSGSGNTYTGTTTISQGTLSLDVPNTIAATSQVILSGGTLATGGLAQDFTTSASPATLGLTASSTLDLGSAAGSTTVKFANSNGIAWTAGQVLTISNWNYGIDHLNLSVAGGLTAQQLSQIKFADFRQGASIADGSTSLALGEVTPQVGDINQDGMITTADIATLMQALANRDAYRTAYFSFPGVSDPTGDINFILDANRDGLVNNLDIQSEIGLVANFISTGTLPGAPPVGGGSLGGGNSVTAVPEPASFVLLGLGGAIVLLQRARRKFVG